MEGRKGLKVGGRTGGKKKEGMNIKGGTKIAKLILVRGDYAQKTHFQMVGRLAHKFTSILNDLNVTFK